MDSTHLCGCGCGKFTKVAERTDARKGWVKGQPQGFVRGHAKRGYSVDDAPDWYLPNTNNGFCHCGCGEPCSRAKSSKRCDGVVRGAVHRYVPGHHPGNDFSIQLATFKTCTGCKESKPLTKFYQSDVYADGFTTRCRACHSKYPSQTPEANLAYLYKARSRNREYAYQYLLQHPCVDCGEPDPIVLEFDHVRDEKKSNVSKLIHNTASLKRLQAEIDKCDVVCANCHRRRTAKTQAWEKSFQLLRARAVHTPGDD